MPLGGLFALAVTERGWRSLVWFETSDWLNKAYQNQNIGWRWGATFVLKVNERGVATEVMREVGLAKQS